MGALSAWLIVAATTDREVHRRDLRKLMKY
jgi:hypothetical protein